MSVSLEDFGKQYVLTLKGEMSHNVTLGSDAKGNLTRIENVLNGLQQRLTSMQGQLQNIYSQMDAAKEELGKPFPQEEELRVKSARLAELNLELNIDDKTPIEAIAETAEVAKRKPSVLDKLKATSPKLDTPERETSHKARTTPER